MHTKSKVIMYSHKCVPVLVTVVCASGRYGAELLAITTEGLRGELVL